jgi:hypothetical protein
MRRLTVLLAIVAAMLTGLLAATPAIAGVCRPPWASNGGFGGCIPPNRVPPGPGDDGGSGGGGGMEYSPPSCWAESASNGGMTNRGDSPPSHGWTRYEEEQEFGTGRTLYRYFYDCIWDSSGTPGEIAELSSVEPGQTQPFVDPTAIATWLRDQVEEWLPAPNANVSPQGAQVVKVPSWFWVDPGDWTGYEAVAEVPGLTVTLNANPTAVTWRTGEGDRPCVGAGTPFNPATYQPQDPSPDCGKTYLSAHGPFEIEVFITFRVTWHAEGFATVTNGDLGTITTPVDTISTQVMEVQTIN